MGFDTIYIEYKLAKHSNNFMVVDKEVQIIVSTMTTAIDPYI